MKSKHVGRDRIHSRMGKFYLSTFDQKREVEPGESITLRVTDIRDPEFIFVNSASGAGVISRSQLIDAEGNVTVNPGEQIEAFFLEEKNGERIFTIFPEGAIARIILKKAYENRTPLTGRVLRAIKGGYEIQIGDETAFCPASQMEGEPAKNALLKFLIIEAPDRNIVVSHRQYLETERQRQKEKMIANLEEGAIIQGKVTSLRDFGAFVDLGSGVEGLIPLSELSHKRVQHPSEVLKSGKEIRVKVLSVDWKEDRITLSLKELQQNPWQGPLPFQTGELLTVTVESIRPFGLFVKLPEGFRGFIPASETGVSRGKPLDKEFQIGQECKAVVVEVNREKQKISLSINRAKELMDRAEYEAYLAGGVQKKDEENISSFGRLLLQSLNQKK